MGHVKVSANHITATATAHIVVFNLFIHLSSKFLPLVFFKVDTSQPVACYSLLRLVPNMPPKSKARMNGAAKPGTPKRRAKQLAQKSQSLPTFSPTHALDLSALYTEPNSNSVMDVLEDISSSLKKKNNNLYFGNFKS